jgi:hypothetical protein
LLLLVAGCSLRAVSCSALEDFEVLHESLVFDLVEIIGHLLASVCQAMHSLEVTFTHSLDLCSQLPVLLVKVQW